MSRPAFTILGAGSVGLTAGARLAASGGRVHFWTRDEAAALLIAREDVWTRAPATGETWRARATASARRPGDGPVLVCVRAPELDGALERVARLAPEALVVSFQNGVESDARLAARFPRALGVVWRQTCTRVAPNRSVCVSPGRVVVGDNPDAQAGRAERDALAAAFRAAGYEVGVTERLRADRWLKLCVNLMSAPNALVRQVEHATRDFVAIKLGLLMEARRVLEAAGVDARPGDPADPDLGAMIEAQRAALVRPPPARPVPVYNDVWTALREGRPLEALEHHRAIVALGRRARVPTPASERVLDVLARAERDGLGPECVGARALLVEPAPAD